MTDEFCKAFGFFILCYADAEHRLRDWLGHELGLPRNINLAIVGSQRVRTLIETARRVSGARGTKIRPEIESALIQFMHITEMRDTLVHQSVAAEEGGDMHVTNIQSAHEVSRIKFFTVPVKAVEDMTWDVRAISQRLWFFQLPEPLEIEHVGLRELVHAPWRYKPLQPTRATQVNLAPLPIEPPPPPASLP